MWDLILDSNWIRKKWACISLNTRSFLLKIHSEFKLSYILKQFSRFMENYSRHNLFFEFVCAKYNITQLSQDKAWLGNGNIHNSTPFGGKTKPEAQIRLKRTNLIGWKLKSAKMETILNCLPRKDSQFLIDISGIIEKFTVYVTAILPRRKNINKAFWLVHIFIKTSLLGRRISL